MCGKKGTNAVVTSKYRFCYQKASRLPCNVNFVNCIRYIDAFQGIQFNPLTQATILDTCGMSLETRDRCYFVRDV